MEHYDRFSRSMAGKPRPALDRDGTPCRPPAAFRECRQYHRRSTQDAPCWSLSVARESLDTDVRATVEAVEIALSKAPPFRHSSLTGYTGSCPFGGKRNVNAGRSTINPGSGRGTRLLGPTTDLVRLPVLQRSCTFQFSGLSEGDLPTEARPSMSRSGLAARAATSSDRFIDGSLPNGRRP